MISSTVMIRRFCSFSITASSSLSTTSKKKRLVFLVLDTLFNASAAPDSLFEVTAIVTQPPSGRDRGRKVMPSPVAQHALDRGFPSDLIFTPVKAGEEAFLFNFKSLEPELCVTAAYGNILPTKFLNIPSKGTVNIHPSLLPLYSGAAPVQRALQDGVKETGVSLAYTVRKLDAGPVIARERITIDDQIKAPDLLDLLFDLGSKLLIRELPSILITPEESWLSFDEDAQVLHNKVFFSIVFQSGLSDHDTVAFRFGHLQDGQELELDFKVIDPSSGESSIIELKIITTRIYSGIRSQDTGANDVLYTKGSLVIPCGGGTALEVLEVQLPGKRAVNAAAFWNGLRG
ncbi:hypothetical protein RND71_011728 [Anisodus tanguticus]|uniref:methionyl-tRNA formyltransferase n=1 Tax=Anisodus tanguticus TaxID=243964 RepID=A0AAE1SDY1_9SOLA|nr:hypothetical protein RND71_011728 [Anisodus tanguticus]